ncbi:MAG: sugar phosphate isomerase/epimerase [Bryobacterales bacterium]|nr:sugar phosphate isomerase/epimerase [Bryobacterales bacterium]
MMTRRTFLAASAAAPAGPASRARPQLILFSKPLPSFDYGQLADAVKSIGFDGVDLTCRSKGHVLPERVERDLPRAQAAFAAQGLRIGMITTELTTAKDPTARPVLSTAAKLGIPYFKLGYYRYSPAIDPEVSIAQVKQEVRGLAKLAKEYGIEAGYHNHSGADVGAAVWDLREILKGLDPKWVGYYYDGGHATVEGGNYGWELSARIALKRLKMVAVKDFHWEQSGGRWRDTWGPLGSGMVQWSKLLKLFAGAGYQGPITLHVEYKTADPQAAIARDAATLKRWIAEAYG